MRKANELKREMRKQNVRQITKTFELATPNALIRAMRDEALKRGLVRDELIDFCNQFIREGEIKACIEHLLDNFKRYFWRYH